MEVKELEVEERAIIGSSESRRIRESGDVPGVVYSGGVEALGLRLNAHKFWMTQRGTDVTQVFKFKSSNKSLDGMNVLIKDLQIEPLKGRPLHVDFLSLKDGQKVTLSVPIVITGESPAIKDGRAMLNQTSYEIKVEADPKSMPKSLSVDISSLEESESIHASDIVLPEGCKLRSNPSLTVVSAISAKRIAAKEAAAAAAAAAAATPEAAAQAATSAQAATGADKDKKK